MSTSLRRRACCAALLAGLGVTACSSGGGSKAAPTTSTRPNAAVRPTVGVVTVASAGAPVELAAADRDEVIAAVGSYVQGATVAPLEGKQPADLAALFAPTAAPSLQGPERDALVDLDVPRSTGPVTPKLLPVSLRGLADPSGAIDLVGATLDLTVEGRAAGGPITIHRSGELMFTRDGGAWKILSYKLAVTRDGAGLGTAASTSSTTKAGS